MKKKINILLIIGAILSLVSVCALFCKFNSLSSIFADWGSFGSYMSGTLGIIISMLNLIIFIILTIEVTKITDKNNEKNLKFEEKKILADIRYDAIKNFESNTLPLLNILGDKLTRGIEEDNSKYIMWEVLKVQYFIKNFTETHTDIFQNIKYEDLYKTLSGFNEKLINKEKGYDSFISDYIKNTQDFTKKMRETMLNEIKDNK